MIARLAGLGWIGKNCLLITPDYGSRVRLTTVLTNAPLQPTGPVMEQRCGDCMVCVTTCPTQALRGRNYVDGEQRSIRLDFERCQAQFEKMKKDESTKPVCGICLYACPFGRPLSHPVADFRMR